MDPEEFGRFGGDVLPAVQVRAPVVKGVSRMEDVGWIVVEPDLHYAGEDIEHLLAVVGVGGHIAAAGLDRAEDWVHHVLFHGDQGHHFDAFVRFELDGVTVALADQVVVLDGGLHEV